MCVASERREVQTEISSVNGAFRNIQKWNANVDWITMTASAKTEGIDIIHADWHRTCRRVVAACSHGMVTELEASIRGYKGLRYTNALFLGKLQFQGLMLIASGGMAQRVIEQDMACDNVSRMDLAVTLWGFTTPSMFIAECAVIAHDYVTARKGLAPKVTLTKDMEGNGSTLYIGSRVSDTFIRIYDKGAESKEAAYTGAIRFEVELKGDRAKHGYEALRDMKWSDRGTIAQVSAWLRRVGLGLPQGLELGVAYEPLVIKTTFDIDRSLQWLEKTVSKTIERIRLAGVSDERIEVALGLRSGAIRRIMIEEKKLYNAELERYWQDALTGTEENEGQGDLYDMWGEGDAH